MLVFSSALGRWVDRNHRLYTLLFTIIVNRVAIVLSCLVWYLILTSNISSRKNALFAIILILGMIEKNARMTNILSMERGWVPMLASSTADAPFNLTHLNTIMRRIDVFCKFIAPLGISTFIATVAPVKIAVVAVALTSMLSFGLEYWCILTVWRCSSSRLRTSQEKNGKDDGDDGEPVHRNTWYGRLAVLVQTSLDAHVQGLQYYFKSPVWIPSLGVAILHASVLTYSATLITYLLNAGLPLGTLTVAKAIGSVFEIGSTFIFPWAVRVLSETKDAKNELYSMEELRGPDPRAQYSLLKSETEEDVRETEDEEIKQTSTATATATACDPNSGVVRVGLWGICGLFFNLVCSAPSPPGLNGAEAEPAKIPVIVSLFYIDSKLPTAHPSSPPPSLSTTNNTVPVILLITFLSISFLGRWTYDLSVTQLTQTLIPASHRSNFGGTEMAIVSGVSLGHWIAAAIWHAQTDFKWLALGSFVAVGLGAGAYARWVKIWRRGERIGER